MDKLKQNITAQFFVVYLRFLIGSSFVFASIVKIKGERFTTYSGASAPIDEAWHLFKTLYASGLYWQFFVFGTIDCGASVNDPNICTSWCGSFYCNRLLISLKTRPIYRTIKTGDYT